MRFKVLLVLCSAVGGSLAVHAKVDCRVVCSTQLAMCVEPSASIANLEKGKGSYRIPDCEAPDRKLAAPASVWYSRKSLLVTKSVPTGAMLASIVSDADKACPGWTCIFDVRSGNVTGANPMGLNAEAAVNPAVIAAGLPYDDIVLPATGVVIRLSEPSRGGALTLTHGGDARIGTYAAANGQVLVPAEVLKVGEAYGYYWEAPGTALKGSFSIALTKTVERATTAARGMVPPNSGPDQAKLALASVYLQVGLGWNARQLIAEVEGGNEP